MYWDLHNNTKLLFNILISSNKSKFTKTNSKATSAFSQWKCNSPTEIYHNDIRCTRIWTLYTYSPWNLTFCSIASRHLQGMDLIVLYWRQQAWLRIEWQWALEIQFFISFTCGKAKLKLDVVIRNNKSIRYNFWCVFDVKLCHNHLENNATLSKVYFCVISSSYINVPLKLKVCLHCKKCL